MSKFLLVEWVNDDPKQFSVVSISYIEDGTLRRDGKKLIGKVLNILWKGSPCEARILDVGSEMKLLAHERKLAEAEALGEEREAEDALGIFPSNSRAAEELEVSAAAATPKRRKTTRQTTEISNILSAIKSVPVSDAEENEDDWKVKYEELLRRWAVTKAERNKYKGKWRKQKSEYKNLKEKYDELQHRDLQVELVQGSGVYMKEADLSTVKLMSTSAPILARNLFRSLFESEEIRNHSLDEKKCNANGNRFVPLPAVDAIRRDAIIGFTLSTFGCGIAAQQDAEWTMSEKRNYAKKCRTLKREVKKSLSDFLREESRKLNKIIV